jgi:hypothetical protein
MTDIGSYITELRNTVTVAGLNHEIWWVFKSKDTRPKYVKALNRYSLYFSTAIHAHFVAILIALYRLYEIRKDTYNIPQLLRRAKTDSKFTPDEIAEFETLYARAKPLWEKVYILRNNAFGHRSTSLTVEEAFAEADVTPNEFSELIEVTKKLMNTISHAYDKSFHAFNLRARQDVIRMLDDLSSTHDMNGQGHS